MLSVILPILIDDDFIRKIELCYDGVMIYEEIINDGNSISGLQKI